MKRNVLVWVEVAIIAALSMALSFIPDFAGWFSPSWGAIILVIFSLRRGLTPGLAAGLLWGLLHFALGKVAFLSVEQVLIEYVIAFAVMGLAGLLYSPFQKALKAEKYTSAITYCKRDSGTRNFHCGSDCVCGVDSSEKNLDSSLGKLCFPSPGLT